MLQQVIDRFKRQRTNNFLRQTCHRQYAFVGMGQHSLTNLYPVLHYLGVPLKYICVTSEEKARLIQQKYPAVKATTCLDDVLGDKDVAGVFVAASPRAHFHLAQQVLKAGKALFIEKPPCMALDELQALNAQCSMVNGQCSMVNALVGLQKRYAPAVQRLKKHIRHEQVRTYDLHYQTGAYPEGDALSDLYIHPLDLVCHLFGPAEVVAAQPIYTNNYLLLLQHDKTVGTLELSTDYTWTTARESLYLVTSSAIYDLDNLDTLTRQPKQRTLFDVPMEKLQPAVPTVQYLYGRNAFNPVPQNNTLVTQGYYDELLTFVNLVEGRRATNFSPLSSLTATYALLDAIRKA